MIEKPPQNYKEFVDKYGKRPADIVFAVTQKDYAEYYEAKLEQARAEVLKAIDDEPEFPSEMPDEMWEAIEPAASDERGLRSLIQGLVRNTVKLTKRRIKERLAFKSGNMPNKETGI